MKLFLGNVKIMDNILACFFYQYLLSKFLENQELLWKVSILRSLFLVSRFCSASLFRPQVVVVLREMLAVDSQELWWKIGLRLLTSNLKSFINGNLNGQFLTVSCGSHWGWQLLKFYCLPTDPSSSVLGMFSLLNFKIIILKHINLCVFMRRMLVQQAYGWEWEKSFKIHQIFTWGSWAYAKWIFWGQDIQWTKALVASQIALYMDKVRAGTSPLPPFSFLLYNLYH